MKMNIIDEFITKLENNNICMHSFLFMKDGKTVAEGYYQPFCKGQLHRMYSVTKSFVSIAVGMLCDEGKLSLDDKVADFFKAEFELTDVHPYLANTTIRDLLIMATPYSRSTYGPDTKAWLKSYFIGAEPDHPSGTAFSYDSCGSYVLGALVKRVSGKTFVDYMRPLFDKIGISRDVYCLEGPDGELWSGSGLMASTEDLAKFTQFLLNRGLWNDEQLVSKDYIVQATSSQIYNNTSTHDYSWYCGYGYQIWMLKDEAFCLNGMGGQFGIGFPGKDIVFACNADIQGNVCGKDVIFNALWDIADQIADAPVIGTDTRNLAINPPKGSMTCDLQQDISGVAFEMNQNSMGMKWLKITFDGTMGILQYENRTGEKTLSFGLGSFEACLFPELYSGDRLFDDTKKKMYTSINAAAWITSNTLLIRSYIIDDYIGNLTMTFCFKGDEVGVAMSKNAQFFLDDYQGFAGGRKTNP